MAEYMPIIPARGRQKQYLFRLGYIQLKVYPASKKKSTDKSEEKF